MFERYAVYVTFDGVLDALGAAWLGWDITSGTEVVHPQLGPLDLSALTKRPRKYGFHATIQAPFYLAPDTSEGELEAAFSVLCATIPPVEIEGLQIAKIGRLFALVPSGDDAPLKELARSVVTQLSALRAPLTPDDLKRRSHPKLSERQRENLRTWGYPHVMEDFRFHVTLTSPLKQDELPVLESATQAYFGPHLPAPFLVTHLTLAGSRADGKFQSLHRTALSG